MKVALSFPGCHRRGGVERVVYESARFLSARGHQVSVLACNWEQDPLGGISYERIASLRWPGFLTGVSYYRSSSARLKELDYDVLGSNGSVCPTGGVHWVQSLQRAWLEQCRQHRRPFTKRWLLQKCNPLHPILLKLEETHFAQRRYSKVIVTTPRVRDDLRRFYGVPPEDVVIIPNGFAPEEFNPQRRLERRSAARAKLKLRDHELVLLFAANELERKGYGTLLKALAILGCKDIKLVVVGRPAISEVIGRASEEGVADRVIAAGHTGDISEYHAAADVFVLPTQYEAFCLAILEALGSGLPVVTTNVPGAGDAIQSGVNGLTTSNPTDAAELAEAIRVVLDADRRSRMSADAPGTVKKFQWPEVLQLYERVLTQHARASRCDPICDGKPATHEHAASAIVN